jgi:phosphoglycolate phosphatase-like HAD superfamily hydrolase
LLDKDIALAVELVEAGRIPDHTRVSAPSATSARICLDKLETFRSLRAHGINGCETWAPLEAPWRDEGLVAKPRSGVGSSGFMLLTSQEALDEIRGDEQRVVQARCQPPEVTIDVFLSLDGGNFRAICRERLETRAGVCTKARVFESDELTALAETIGRGLGLFGACCIQVMRDASNAWSVTDVNARPGGGAVDLDEIWMLKRQGLSTKHALLEIGVHDDVAERLAQRWADAIEDPRWLSLDALLPGVAELLSELARQGTRPVVITARRHADRAESQAESLGLLRWCSGLRVVAPEVPNTAKADELVAIEAAGFVGDTESDARAADLAGVAFAAVVTGQRSRAFLEEQGLPTFASLAEAVREVGFAV